VLSRHSATQAAARAGNGADRTKAVTLVR